MSHWRPVPAGTCQLICQMIINFLLCKIKRFGSILPVASCPIFPNVWLDCLLMDELIDQLILSAPLQYLYHSSLFSRHILSQWDYTRGVLGFQVYMPAVLHCVCSASIPGAHIGPNICHGWVNIYSLLFLCYWPADTLLLAEQLSDQHLTCCAVIIELWEHRTYQRRLETAQLKQITESDKVRILQGFVLRLGLMLPGSDQVIWALYSLSLLGIWGFDSWLKCGLLNTNWSFSSLNLLESRFCEAAWARCRMCSHAGSRCPCWTL